MNEVTVRRIWRRTGIALISALIIAVPTNLLAHNIPADTKVFAFVKPEGTTLHVLVRVSLDAMRTMKFPLRDSVFLDFAAAKPQLEGIAAEWINANVKLYEGKALVQNARVVAARVSLPSDRSVETYDKAIANVTAPSLPDSTVLPWRQGILDILVDYPIQSDRSDFSISFALLSYRTLTVLRFLAAGARERAYQYYGETGLVHLDPRWSQAAWLFVKMGFAHILDGIDHLLFIFGLVIPFRRVRGVLVVITSFTVAHSITLIASALGLAPSGLWFPPLIEALIAFSILYMAVENIVGAQLKRRWLIAFGFGLVHGFGFSFALRDSLQFAGSNLATSLVSFNVGVELGQMFVLTLILPALAIFFKYFVIERLGTILLSGFVAHTAYHWLTNRVRIFASFPFTRPALDRALLLSVLRGAALVLVLVAIGWGLYTIVGRSIRPSGEEPAPSS